LNFLRLDNPRLLHPQVKRIVLPVNFESSSPFPKRRSKKTGIRRVQTLRLTTTCRTRSARSWIAFV
jgi:hypothetical protein